jgi:hypothetical protein
VVWLDQLDSASVPELLLQTCGVDQMTTPLATNARTQAVDEARGRLHVIAQFGHRTTARLLRFPLSPRRSMPILGKGDDED